MSVDAFQEIEMLVVDAPVFVTPVGAVGGVVSEAVDAGGLTGVFMSVWISAGLSARL